jgi:hypothetical protein
MLSVSVLMDYNIKLLVWKVMCWYIRDLNANDKQLAMYNKIVKVDVLWLVFRKPKRRILTEILLRAVAPKQFDTFAFSPSLGARGVILVVWKSSLFKGTLLEVQRFGIVIVFESIHTKHKWMLVVVYGPCEGEQRDWFVQWLFNLNIPDDELWHFMGDFKFIHSQENRNRPGVM